MKPSVKCLFLLDGIGALCTAALLYFLLAGYQHLFGMPLHVLHLLSAAGLACAIYSFSCYLLLKKNRQPFLRVIALVNILYCIGTLILIMLYYDLLKPVTLAYFAIEIMIIALLACFELKAAGSKT